MSLQDSDVIILHLARCVVLFMALAHFMYYLNKYSKSLLITNLLQLCEAHLTGVCLTMNYF